MVVPRHALHTCSNVRSICNSVPMILFCPGSLTASTKTDSTIEMLIGVYRSLLSKKILDEQGPPSRGQ